MAPASHAAEISALAPLSEEADDCAAANQEAWTTFADDNEPEDLSWMRSLASVEDDSLVTTSTPSKRLTDLEKWKLRMPSSQSEGREVAASEDQGSGEQAERELFRQAWQDGQRALLARLLGGGIAASSATGCNHPIRPEGRQDSFLAQGRSGVIVDCGGGAARANTRD